MNIEKLRKIWKMEEDIAHISGWDFSHLKGRFEEDSDLPWNYKSIIQSYLKTSDQLLDIDTGGGEFLLTLGHDPICTTVTEGYAPNVALCRKKLTPLGIHVEEVIDYSSLPFDHESFDIVINRHGAYDVNELFRILKPNGVFITQQVGEDNDRELVDLLLPGTPKPFPGMNMDTQTQCFQFAGFDIVKKDEVYRPIRFYDVGALVWFAKVIEWEFPNFSVDNCFERLLEIEKIIEKYGYIQGMIHRYMIVARKK